MQPGAKAAFSVYSSPYLMMSYFEVHKFSGVEAYSKNISTRKLISTSLDLFVCTIYNIYDTIVSNICV